MLPGTLADKQRLIWCSYLLHLTTLLAIFLYQTRHDIFEKLHPEYKNKDDVFIPHHSLKEKVKEALDEFHKEYDS